MWLVDHASSVAWKDGGRTGRGAPAEVQRVRAGRRVVHGRGGGVKQPLGWDDPPRMVVQRTGAKERGFMAWRCWVSHGPMRYQGEYGTYAWTRKGAERKARWLLAKFEKTRSGPEIEVRP